MPRRPVLALLGALALVAACEPRPTARTAPAPAPARATPPPAPAPAPAEPPPAPPPVQPAADVADTDRANEALEHAADRAQNAVAGADECESAHNQLIAMLETVEAEMHQPVHRPERAPFLEVCREMPPAARKCVVPTYAMANQEECGTALEALPDDVQQRFQMIINGSN